MKKIIAILIALSITTANADIVIRNKNTTPRYAMHVTYRLCNYNRSRFECDAPQHAVIPKAGDFIVSGATMLVIDAAQLINEKDNSIKAQTTYAQIPFLNSNITLTSCRISEGNDIENMVNGLSNTSDKILFLDDKGSADVNCRAQIIPF